MNRVILLFFIVALIALVWSWNEPLLSGNPYRQVQTAQVAQVFLQEGWNPFLTQIRFFGGSGIAILEFPIYQSLITGTVRLIHLSLENTGRLFSWLSALLLALACEVALRGIRPLLGDRSYAFPPFLAALFVFISPLVFGMSQWVTIELMNAAFAAWAFVFFHFFLLEKGSVKRIFWGAIYGIFVLASLLMKPHGIFPIALLFVWRYGKEAVSVWSIDEERKAFIMKTLLVVLMTVSATMAAVVWYQYGEQINKSVHFLYPISEGMKKLMFGQYKIWQIHVLTRLGGRFILYVLGPGTTVLFAVLFLSQRQKLLKKNRLIFIISCILSILLYLSLFTGANFIHNYYQVVTIFPLYLCLFTLFSWLNKKWTSVILIICILVNISVSMYALTNQDENWKMLLAYLETKIPKGYSKPTLNIVSNWGASAPVISYYLERYTIDKPFSDFADGKLQDHEWIVLYDKREIGVRSDDAERITLKKPKTFGPIDLFFWGDYLQ